ncbi:MAG TPA: hypothetical protein VGC95_02160, partial [Chitinophagaceae bacterium]
MKPDRHNYEEYFLLYVDNELSPGEVKEVELFVRNNPDLEAEFQLLQQSKLPADDSIVFDNKDQLFRINEPGFDPMTHQES